MSDTLRASIVVTADCCGLTAPLSVVDTHECEADDLPEFPGEWLDEVEWDER